MHTLHGEKRKEEKRCAQLMEKVRLVHEDMRRNGTRKTLDDVAYGFQTLETMWAL